MHNTTRTNTNGYITVNNININAPRLFGEGLSAAEFIEAQVNASRQSAAVTKAMGTELLMFAEGDLFPQGLPHSRDIGVAKGLANYAQAITHRLMTTRGTHPEDYFFGVPWDNYIGNTYMSRGLIIGTLIVDITEELYKDRRTSRVVYVNAEFTEPTIIDVKCAVEPVLIGEEINFSLTVNGR